MRFPEEGPTLVLIGDALDPSSDGLADVAVAVLRWPMVWVVLGLGSAAVAFAWWRIARR